jgi:hypothetical protein
MAIRKSLLGSAALPSPASRPVLVLCSLALSSLALPSLTLAQTDPGVRPGAVNGQSGATATSPLPLASVTANTPQGVSEFFVNGLGRFQVAEVVSGGKNNGLGPRFNFDSCSGCHAQPTIGGSGLPSNPQATVFSSGGGNPPIASSSTNTIPSFITANGPTREARFPFFFNASGTGVNTSAPNGGVEDLFPVSGRSDAGTCSLAQPGFAFSQSVNDVIFRIPTPVFGAGLLENLDDSTLLANQAAQANNGLGISGTFNHNGNDGTIARFGWKAQNKSRSCSPAKPTTWKWGREGKVKHVHFLSAFPAQSQAITAALSQWRFKPYLRNGQPVEVETGMLFGRVPREAL